MFYWCSTSTISHHFCPSLGQVHIPTLANHRDELSMLPTASLQQPYMLPLVSGLRVSTTLNDTDTLYVLSMLFQPRTGMLLNKKLRCLYADKLTDFLQLP